MINTKKRIIICIAVGLALISVIGALVNMNPDNPSDTVAELLSLGQRFLLELDYEQALVQFLRVIEIEPRNAQGYYGAARAFIGMGQVEDAIDILRRGIELTGDAQLQALLGELLGNEQAEAAVVEQTDDSDELNLTGQPPLTRREFEEMGLGVHIQDLVGRFDITQEYVDYFFSPDFRPSAWRMRGDVQIPMIRSIAGTNIHVDRASGIVVSMAFSPREFNDTVLRFEFGMTLLGVLNTLAVTNPDIISAAENPTRENLLALGTPQDSIYDIARISDKSILNEDGDTQSMFINIFSEEIEERSPDNAAYALAIFLYPGISVWMNFDADGGMRTVRMDAR